MANQLQEGDVVEECPDCKATGAIEFTKYHKGEIERCTMICDRCDGLCYIKHECDDCQRDSRTDIPDDFYRF